MNNSNIMGLVNFFRKIKHNFTNYNPSVKIFISQSRLLHNLQEYQKKYPQLLFAPVLKSNAYGHGLTAVAKILDGEKIAFFVLDSLFEAMILRKNNIRSEILVIGYTQTENIINSRLANISFTITSLEQLRDLASQKTGKIKIQLKIDTGMHRQGVLPAQINEAIKIMQANKKFILEGICSHFADADSVAETFTRSQIAAWEKCAVIFKEKFSGIKFFHIAATAGTFYGQQTVGNVARLGLGLYGINPSPFINFDLQPVMQIHTIITAIKNLQQGEFVGYNATYQLKQDSFIATVPIGYFEGVDRRLSNCGFLKIKNKFCPIVGRVSMNITSIDVTQLPDLKLGEEVIVISNNKDDKNSVENMAKTVQTIPWELLIHIPQHLRRIIVK